MKCRMQTPKPLGEPFDLAQAGVQRDEGVVLRKCSVITLTVRSDQVTNQAMVWACARNHSNSDQASS